MNGENLAFLLADELSTCYNAAIYIFSGIKSSKSAKAELNVKAHVTALIEMWIESLDICMHAYDSRLACVRHLHAYDFNKS